jgi:hypothetical protein
MTRSEGATDKVPRKRRGKTDKERAQTQEEKEERFSEKAR